jgi:NifU-like protein involved in Fe-S cluster formation
MPAKRQRTPPPSKPTDVSASAALYTPEVLALATSLSDFPLDDTFPLVGKARSKTCGSTLRLGLEQDPAGQITRIGLAAHACAIGQAAAAIFAKGAIGRQAAEIAGNLVEIEDWLKSSNHLPNWRGLEAIERARDYPARHGAIILAWVAALDALPSSDQAS